MVQISLWNVGDDACARLCAARRMQCLRKKGLKVKNQQRQGEGILDSIAAMRVSISISR